MLFDQDLQQYGHFSPPLAPAKQDHGLAGVIVDRTFVGSLSTRLASCTTVLASAATAAGKLAGERASMAPMDGSAGPGAPSKAVI
jgi:hypothetical protein